MQNIMCRGHGGGQIVTEGAGQTNCYRGRGGDKMIQRAQGDKLLIPRKFIEFENSWKFMIFNEIPKKFSELL